MFKRKLELRVVKMKDTTPEGAAVAKDDFDDRLVGVTIMGKHLMRQAALCVGGYIILDTGRKVAVTLAEKK